jgi:glycosyltransferase involved in cell wall biosynthesis
MKRPLAVVNSSGAVGGAELSLLPVVARLCDAGPVLAFLPEPGPLAERLAGLGAEVVPGFELDGTLTSASRQYGAGRVPRVALAAARQQARLAGALRRRRPAVVYCNGFRAQLGASVPAFSARAQVAWHVRDFVPAGPAGSVWARLARRASLVVANSAAVGSQPALAGLSRPALVVPNGVDLTRFRPRESEPAGPPVLGMVGHLTPWKGHVRFLRLVRAVRDRRPDVEARIAGAALYDTAGHDSYPAELEAELERLDLAGACTIETVSPEAMPDWLAQLTLLAHCPDRPEPFGRGLVEAMAVGVPVVAAAGPGAAEVVGDAGVLLPLADEEALLAAVLELLEGSGTRARLAEAGARRASERFDEAAYAERVAAELLRLS